MVVKDLNPQDLEDLDPKKLEALLLQQGHEVLKIINTPGWQIIENALRLERFNIEDEGIAAVRGVTSKEKGIFHMGEISGLKRCIKVIYGVIQKAKEVQSNRDNPPGANWDS